ncbi:hypothetical protein EJB05_03953, partial [Eragrostis curvula]
MRSVTISRHEIPRFTLAANCSVTLLPPRTRRAMDPNSLLLLPRASCPSIPIAAAAAAAVAPLNNSRRISGTRLGTRRRWRHAAGLSSSVSAVAAETPRTEEAPSPSPSGEEQFDWLDQWYPLSPVCDLDPRAPHGKTVLGLRVVAWHDRGAGEWRVFDDACPHRLAPLSEGRIDDKGRLQCVYHGWCFDGAGACKFIPQAPALGPPVHKNSKACVASYPCVVQNRILWFYPRAEPEYRDVLQRKRPPFIPEIDDPEFVASYATRDLFYGHSWKHCSIAVEYDKEGGGPIKMKIEAASKDGFLTTQDRGSFQFIAPCTFYGSPFRQEASQGKKKTPRFMLVFFCVPVSPGRSRLIWTFPRNVGERKFAAAGIDNWQKVCYVPTSSDSMVIAFRNWLRKFSKNQIGWATPQADQLPPTPTKDKLMDRYWSHVAQCTSCSAALKTMKALEVALQVASVAVVGFLAVAKGTLVTSTVQRAIVVSMAVLCFAASRWLANFIEKNFYFQDYVHAYK